MIYGVIGKPRSGKTTLLAKEVYRNNNRKKLNLFLDRLRFPSFLRLKTYTCIYSNEFIEGCVEYNTCTLGSWRPVPNSLILIHEAGVFYNNRNHKDLPNFTAEFFAKHGHLKCDIIWDSQTADVDIKLRQRTERIFIIKKPRWLQFFNKHLSLIYQCNIDVDVYEATQKIEDVYSRNRKFLSNVFGLFTGTTSFFYRKPYYKLFDSYSDTTEYRRSAPTKIYKK